MAQVRYVVRAVDLKSGKICQSIEVSGSVEASESEAKYIAASWVKPYMQSCQIEVLNIKGEVVLSL